MGMYLKWKFKKLIIYIYIKNDEFKMRYIIEGANKK